MIGKKLLVTGGAGFIGSNFILYLYEKYGEELELVNLDSLTYAGNAENLKKIDKNRGYRFVRADICDKDAVFELFNNNDFDYVFHFAAESHVDRSIKNPEIFAKTNVMGTVNLLNAARKSWTEIGFNGRKFVQVSTDEVYGSLPETGFFTEKTPLDAKSPYSASKAAADMIVSAYSHTFGLPVNITRCSNNYGAYQFPEKLIPLMLNNALAGKKLPVYGDGQNVRDWLYVNDHVSAVALVGETAKPGEVYNIGGNNEKKNIELVHILIDTLHDALPDNDTRKKHVNKGLIEFVKDRPGHDRRYAIDASKIERELGWKPETPFDDGIKKTVNWYLQNNDWVQSIVSGEYLKYYEEMYTNEERL